jgi:hypothetical protein
LLYEGLQKSLDKLSEYCKKWQLPVNVKKTKAITFQQRNIPYNKSDLYLNGYKFNLSKDFCRPSVLSDRSKMSSANMRQFKDSVSNVTG